MFQTHGLVLRSEEHQTSSELSKFCPLTLFPSPFPRRLFDEAMAVHPLSLELYSKVAWDYEFLLQALGPVVETDEFIAKMMGILATVHGEGIRQKTFLLLQRADYMA